MPAGPAIGVPPEDPRRRGRLAEKILAAFTSRAIPEDARLGRTLAQRPEALLAYLSTDDSENGRTAAINGLIELHRRGRGMLSQSRQLQAPDAPDWSKDCAAAPHWNREAGNGH